MYFRGEDCSPSKMGTHGTFEGVNPKKNDPGVPWVHGTCTHGTFSVAQISLIGTLGISTSIFGRVMCVEGQTALVRPFMGEFDMLPNGPPSARGLWPYPRFWGGHLGSISNSPLNTPTTRLLLR